MLEINYLDLPLDIRGLITDELDQNDIFKFRRVCKRIQTLEFEIWLSNKTLTLKDVDDSILEHLDFLKFTNSVDLRYCNKITDDGLQWLRNCKNIDLRYCYNFTSDGLQWLRNCENINLPCCLGISGDGLQWFDIYLIVCRLLGYY